MFTIGMVAAALVLSCNKKDESVAVTGVQLSENQPFIARGGVATLTAAVLPENADNKTVTWASSVPEIASVDQNGLVKGLKKRETIIVVTTQDGRKTAMCQVSVTEYVPVSEVLLFEKFVLEIGAGYQMKANVLPKNASNKAVVWKSSDESVATIDQKRSDKSIERGRNQYHSYFPRE